MCDEHTEHDNEASFASGRLSRRGFSVMSLAALAACTTSPENAATVVEREVEITTPDGVMDAHYVAPSSASIRPSWCGRTSWASAPPSA
jgi:carboxymethylenebutenolidase